MKITEKTIDYVAALAKLELQAEEKERALSDLSDILGLMERMKELDTKDILPMSHIFEIQNVFREDVSCNENDRENLLKNAPAKKDGSFMVPKTVE